MASIKKGKKTKKPGRGRPKTEINLRSLEKLCALQCTYEELASYFNCSVPTIERLAATEKGAAAIERGRNKGKISLRRKQVQLLNSGSNTMAIWLGKQYLGQRDKLDTTLRTPPGEVFRIEAEVNDRQQALLLSQLFSSEEIAAAHAKLEELERAGRGTSSGSL